MGRLQQGFKRYIAKRSPAKQDFGIVRSIKRLLDECDSTEVNDGERKVDFGIFLL